MDHSASKEQDIGFDLESGTDVINNNEEGSLDLCLNVNLLMDRNVEEEKVGDSTWKKMGKEKGKKGNSAKKPPRPPRGFSLDAYDKNLIKELAELAMIKRARIERMKALKQKKTLKVSSSSSSSSSHASLFAMLFTIIFLLVILLQGRNTGVSFKGSPQMAQIDKNGLIFTKDQLNPSASGSISPNFKTST